MQSRKLLFFLLYLLPAGKLSAQNYHAMNGSIYAGSLSPAANPAAIVYVPYSWDVTPLALQFKQNTNAFIIKNFSLLSPSGNAEVINNFGTKKRFLFFTQDIRLLNTRINLNASSAIAFGGTIRNYFYGSSNTTNYQDTSYSLADFQRINLENQPLNFNGAASAWAELYASYARTIKDDGYTILNAGVTIKYNHSLAGGYVQGRDVRYVPDNDTVNRGGFILTNGSLQYGYSANIDNISGNKSLNNFLQNTYAGISADIGMEYIFLSTDEADEDDPYAYKTKAGISIMDIGGNRFRYSNRSRFGNTVKTGINDTILEAKFKPVKNMDDFNDSLATIANPLATLNGDFTVYKPTRLVINIDQHIREDFFINAELTLPLISLAGKNYLYIKDINLLSVTPRWEKRRIGAYMPMLFNMRKQLMIGGALRAGPLLFGIHNLANLFTKNSIQNGGMYLAVTIRPGNKHGQQKDKNNNIDKEKIKRLRCTKF